MVLRSGPRSSSLTEGARERCRGAKRGRIPPLDPSDRGSHSLEIQRLQCSEARQCRREGGGAIMAQGIAPAAAVVEIGRSRGSEGSARFRFAFPPHPLPPPHPLLPSPPSRPVPLTGEAAYAAP